MKALYAGSFDPITFGHIDLIRRVSVFYRPFLVLAASSPWKKYLFSLEERKALIEDSLKDLPHVEVDLCEGLVVDYAKKKEIKIFIRGARVFSDFEYELAMSQSHRRLFPESETLISLASTEWTHCSSKIVKELAFHGASVSHLVPEAVCRALNQKRKELRS